MLTLTNIILFLVAMSTIYNYRCIQQDFKTLKILSANQDLILKSLEKLFKGDIALSQDSAQAEERVSLQKRPVGFKLPQDKREKRIGFQFQDSL